MADSAGLLATALRVSRPVSWINTAYPFAAAMLVTAHGGSWLLVVGAIFFLIPYNLAMYGINDVFDYASDMKNPRKGGIEGAVLDPEFHRPLLILIAVTTVPFVAVLAVAGWPRGAAWLAVSVFAVVAYSAPRLRFKERPVLDSMTSATHFVSPAVVGVAMAGGAFTKDLVMVLIAFFLWGMAAHAFGAVQDVVPDRQGGIASIATAFGARNTVRLSMGLWAAAGVLLLTTPWPGPLAAVLVVPYLINAAPWWNVTDARSGETNVSWRRFMALNYACGFAVTLLLIAVWTAAE